MLANLIRGCLGEFGIVALLGIRRIAELVGIIRDEADSRLPPYARIAMIAVADQLGDLQRRIKEIERRSGRARWSWAIAARVPCRSTDQIDRRERQDSRAGSATSSRSAPSGWPRRQSR
jgi:hypothetical protein